MLFNSIDHVSDNNYNNIKSYREHHEQKPLKQKQARMRVNGNNFK